MDTNSITSAKWHGATDLSNRLFKEADQLDGIAFALLTHAPASPDAARKYQAARNSADAKYAEARQAWEEAKANFQITAKRKEISRRAQPPAS